MAVAKVGQQKVVAMKLGISESELKQTEVKSDG
jgi:DNA-binding transcriptional regulator YdaS (Cro superfamily)